MTPQDFVKRWQEIADESLNAPFRVVEAAQAQSLQIPDADRGLLTSSGLPSETCSFRLDMFPPLHRVYEHFAPSEWNEKQKEAVADCWVLGEDGGGNAICFSEPKGGVWLLDHECFFQQREFINSSLSAFAEFLLLDLEGWSATMTYRAAFERMKQVDLAATEARGSNGAKTYWCGTMLNQIEEYGE